MSLAILMTCAAGLMLPAKAADTGGISTYLSNAGFSILENSKYSTVSDDLVPITYDLDGTFVKGGTIQNAMMGKVYCGWPYDLYLLLRS